MINNNKILTVSYGTFSCTLEGFDDSFGTMKAIAEYFRDLASDDRYFGAEPPQPDAEMLQRIAQKEISRKVEAREHEGKIVLSALEDGTASSAGVAVPVAAVAQAATLVDAVEDTSDDTTDDDTVEMPVEEAPEADIAADDHADGDTIEANGTALPDAPSIEDAPEPDRKSEAHAKASADADTASDDTFVEDENDIVPGQPDADVEAFFDAGSDTLADDPAEDAPAAQAATDAEPNSIAAKLQRIRAVVAQQGDADEDPYSEDEHAEANAKESSAKADAADEAMGFVDLQDEAESDTDKGENDVDVIAAARREIEDALDADEAHEVEALEAEAEAVSDEEVDDIAAILARMELDVDDSAAPQKADASAEAGEDSLVADLIAQEAKADDGENLFDADANDAPAHDAKSDAANSHEAEAYSAEAARVAADDAAEKSSEAASNKLRLSAEQRLQPEAEEAAAEVTAELATPARPRARVIKVKRADLDAAIARGDLEEYDDEDEDDTPVSLDDIAPARTADSSLSPEDEDELARELAALEADIEREQSPSAEVAEEAPAAEARADMDADDFAKNDRDADTVRDHDDMASDDDYDDHDADDILDAVADKGSEAAGKSARAARAKLPSLDDDQDDNMDRLMSEADHQMGEPESATRRDAFAHLRAAVAAKKADQALGSDHADGGGDDAYRNDLADVVRPRRPSKSGAVRSMRPSEDRAAPLKLVAEQRIDVSKVAAASGPVRPRRVASIAEAVTPEGEESFAEFAADMGATKLPDLLEAAAAYMAFVEGREQFSRPQLMTKVRQAGSDGFSREDTLRSFGKLLRDGKIEKIKGGRFVASDDIGFRPDQRAAS